MSTLLTAFVRSPFLFTVATIWLALSSTPDALAAIFYSSPRRNLTPDEGRIFGAVNKVSCSIANNRRIESTAPLIVNNQVAVTVAHAFYNEGTNSEELSPADCEYVVYDANDHIIDRVKITTIKSRWVEDNRYYDLTQDIALIKLERPPKGHLKPFRLETGPSDPGTPIEIIGFHVDIDGGQRRIFSEGTIVTKTGSEQEHNETVLIHNASAVNETSGAPLIDKNNGLILGLHLGRTHAPDKEKSLNFDARHNYNRAIIFDQQFVRDLHMLMK
jgi:hypothetical protein